MWAQSLGQKDPLEEDMVTNSSIHAWKIPWTEKLVAEVAKSWTQLRKHTKKRILPMVKWEKGCPSTGKKRRSV